MNITIVNKYKIDNTSDGDTDEKRALSPVSIITVKFAVDFLEPYWFQATDYYTAVSHSFYIISCYCPVNQKINSKQILILYVILSVIKYLLTECKMFYPVYQGFTAGEVAIDRPVI